MQEYLPITHYDQRAWYELSFDARRATIILRVHRNFIGAMKFGEFSNWPIVDHFKQQFGFDLFDGSLEQDFGFESCFRFVGRLPDGWNEFAAKLPRVKNDTGKPCEACRGTGKDYDAFDLICFECYGTGKEYDLNWHQVFALSASFTVFSSLAFAPEWATGFGPPSDRLQLFTIQTTTMNGMHGGSLGGMYGIPLVRWLKRFPANTRIRFVEDAMRVAYNRMLHIRPYNQREFRAWIVDDNGWLNIDCPGDACGLHPSDMFGSRRNEGYEFACHNVDSPMQQLTLITGLAALCDLARR